jgi:hypothetical protein
MAQAFADEFDESLHPFVGDELLAELRQDVERVSEAHEIVVALHRVPVEREKVLMLVAVALLDKKGLLDAPSVARPQISTFVQVLLRQGFARYPGMPRDSFLDVASGVDLVPVLLTNDDMDELCASAV